MNRFPDDVRKGRNIAQWRGRIWVPFSFKAGGWVTDQFEEGYISMAEEGAERDTE
jgi:hypothetical protein